MSSLFLWRKAFFTILLLSAYQTNKQTIATTTATKTKFSLLLVSKLSLVLFYNFHLTISVYCLALLRQMPYFPFVCFKIINKALVFKQSLYWNWLMTKRMIISLCSLLTVCFMGNEESIIIIINIHRYFYNVCWIITSPYTLLVRWHIHNFRFLILL